VRLPLLLEQVGKANIGSVIGDTLEHFGITDKLERALVKSGTYYDVVGYLAECYLSSTTPDLDKPDLAILRRLAKEGCLRRGFAA